MQLESCFRVSLSLFRLSRVRRRRLLTIIFQLVPPQPPPPQPPKIKSSDSDGSGLVIPLLLSSKRLSWNFEDFILGGGPPECYFGRWPPAYYSRTPLPTVKKEQEILRAKFASPDRNGDNGIATAGNTGSLRGCFFYRLGGSGGGGGIFSVCGDLVVASPKANPARSPIFFCKLSVSTRVWDP